MKKTTTRLFCCVTVLSALFASCQPQNPSPNPTPTPSAGRAAGAPGPAGAQGFGGGQRPGGRNQVIPVQVSTVVFGPLTASNTSAGVVSPEIQSSVAAGANGTVRTIVRKAGEWVSAGDVVIQLDDTQLKLSLALAQTSLQNALVNAGFDESGKPSPTSTIALKIQYAQSDVAAKQRTYEADLALFKLGGVTQTTLDNDQSAIQNAQATLESLKASVQQSTMTVQTATLQVQQAQLNLSNASIKAPFDGQIAAVNLRPGEYVGTSTAAFVLVSRNKILTFSVPPSDAPGLTWGTPVKFTYGGTEYQARITQLPAAPVGGLIPLTASLPTNLSPPLGTVGTITYTVELARGALVPLPAVQSAENTTFVFTADEANKVGKSQVTILAETGAFAAVAGVKVGTTVVLNPPPGLLVGSTVQPQTAEGQALPTPPAPATTPAPAEQTRRRPAPTAEAGETPAPGAAGRGNFDPSKLTPEQRAEFQARRKAAQSAQGSEAPTPPTGGQ